MKSFLSAISTLTLLSLPLLSGCTQPPQNANVPVSRVEAPLPPPALVTSEPPVKAEPAPAVAPVVPPSNLQLTPAMVELTKLAQAGVDEAVMISYITNSTQLFNAGADEIVYLNDLGVSGNVITTMMQHDQAMKQFWAANAQQQPVVAQSAQMTTTASAPAYVEPPQTVAVESAPQQPATVVNNNYFYDSLSSYGTWIEVEGYGRCWQPTVVVVNRDWRPYCDRGRWVYTDCGWYWLSEYSWGATTFHYGRWFSHPRWGWCWWPDTVWGPSWVTWRSGADYCGWAPLPPHSFYRSGVGFTYYGRSVSAGFDFGLSVGWFTYVPWGRFCDPRPRRHCATPTQVTHIHNNTTIINNYGSGNNTVVNNGVPVDSVRKHSNADIKQIRVREDDTLPRKGRGEQLAPDGGTLAVYRPPIDSHRKGGNRNGTVQPSTSTTPAVNLAAPATTPGNTTARNLENPELHRQRGDADRDNPRPVGRKGQPAITTPTAPNVPIANTSPATSVTPPAQSPNTPVANKPSTITQPVNRKGGVTSPVAGTEREQVHTETPQPLPAQNRESHRKGQSPALVVTPQQTTPANTTRVWTQPQAPQPLVQQPVAPRVQTPNQVNAPRKTAQDERPVYSTPPNVTTSPNIKSYSPAPAASPRPVQVNPTPASPAPRQVVESRPTQSQQVAPPQQSVSPRSESRRTESSRSSNSGNSDSGSRKKGQ